MSVTDINLLKTKSTLSPEQMAILDHLRTVGYALVTLALFGGILTGSVFFFLSMQVSQADTTKRELLRSIAAESRKEALWVSLNDRIPIVRKVWENKSQWASIVELIPSIAYVPALNAVTVDDKKITQLTISTDSIDETAEIVNRVMQLVAERKIYNPQLVGLQVTERGAVQMTLSFLPLF